MALLISLVQLKKAKQTKEMTKTQIATALFVVLILTLTASLLTKKEIETKIISNKQIISMYHTDQTEEVKISLLTTNPSSFYFNKDYVTFTRLYNQTQTVSLKLVEINITDDLYEYNETPYYLVEYLYTLPFTGTNTYINMDDVNLSIDYDNGDNIDLYLGEFNYLFSTFNDDDITLGNLSATYQYVNNIETVGGINLTLKNITTDNLNITNIKILSTNVKANYGEVLVREECNYLKTVSECIVDDYNINSYTESDITFLLRKNNNLELYIPLSYLNQTQYIYRFSIIVEYTQGGIIKEYILDDFPFMSKGIYLKEMESNYSEATISNQSN